MKGGNGVSAANEVTLSTGSPNGECVIPLPLVASLPPSNLYFNNLINSSFSSAP